MKEKLVIVLIFIIQGYNIFAQDHPFINEWITYTNNLEEGGTDLNTNVAVDGENNVYITKATMDYYNDHILGSLTKFSPDGELLWTSESFGRTEGLTIDQNGDIIISGYTALEVGIATNGTFQETYGGGYGDGFLMKFRDNGEIIWGTYFGGTGTESGNNAYFLGLEVTEDNDIIYSSRIQSEDMATPGTFQYERNGAEYTISKFTTNGQREWTTYYGADEIHQQRITGLQVDGSDIYITGWVWNDTVPNSYFDTFGDYDFVSDSKEIFVSKFDSTGIRVWSQYLPGNGDEDGRRHALALINDHLYITFSSTSSDFGTEGTSFPHPGSGFPGVLVKIDLEGNLVWSTYLPDSIMPYNNSPSIFSNNINGIYAMGSTFAVDDGLLGMFNREIEDTATHYIIKFSDEGEMIWGNYLGNSSNTEWFQYAMAFHDAGFYTIGSSVGYANIATEGAFQDTPDGNYNHFLTKYKDDILGVENLDTVHFTAYPIPASNILHLDLNRNLKFPILAKIYNTLGQLVKMQEILESVSYINVGVLSSGVYFLEVETGSRIEKKRVIIK